MAPYTASSMLSTEHSHKAQGIRKIRKPVVEKMRRDRINSSIEQLRMLLEKEFEQHHLPSKPEKADILEVAVSFLQQQMASKYAQSSSPAYMEGHSRCLQDSQHFFSLQKHSELPEKLLQNFHDDVTACPSVSPFYQNPAKCTTPEANKVLWRPW
ncbi:hairy and enhancer of split 5, gene 7 L homeolog [Xenopus laevis]|uniref:Transcription factor HES-5 n=2 Tax=Xenopus laevis TaxID=8355 RepID=Q53U30_XENLA|nr:hairy and enhancer of split 5, gene 7 L homeolog [Xenopus laevis]OCT72808.1 hypothetical protein XELAEV_18035790mg [Xenopus laevis]BAD95803.1 enhancer of split related protein 9b [Xenopus laevis]